ncbi:MAG: quinolinate synthase NadA [Fibrobacteria bacterium]|nr:quinolinate synthase NadA [Fibrobacteria bacterium]
MVTAESLYKKLGNIKIGGNVCKYTMEKCKEYAPLINEINELKKEKNAVILAHSYVSPEVIHGVSDYSGDSYELSKNAQGTDAETIVFSAVRFMAETAKILNPEKQVLIPSSPNGCTLADAISGEEVKRLKAENPDFTFICYINTTAEVKAECDVCVTSSNVYKIAENVPNDKIFFVPDKLMGLNLIEDLKARGINKTIKIHHGTCYAHEKYDEDMIQYIRQQYPDAEVLSHPECNAGVLKHSDYVGSTSQMINYVKASTANAFFLLTECGLSARLQLELPDKKFVGTCTLCKYMKANTLEDILRVLKAPEQKDIVELDEEIRKRALHCISEMFRYTEG